MGAALRRLALLAVPVTLLLWAAQAPGHEPRPFVAIIIDDLGNRHDAGLRTLALPGAVTLAFLPHTPFADRLARQGHEAGKEIMLHLPMEAADGQPMGPGGLYVDMEAQALRDTFLAALASVPHARGVNNHMGSLLTRHPAMMEQLMDQLTRHGGLYFVDSRTTRYTVAQRTAAAHQLPVTRRNVFLDPVPNDEAMVEAEMDRLLALARRQGHALAIGHPHDATLDVLERRLAAFHETGVELVSVSEYLKRKEEATRQWQASLSPSPTAAKSLKPSH